MVKFEEEAAGVLNLRLFDPPECEAILKDLLRNDCWEQATVRVPASSGEYESVSQPDIRSASILFPDHSVAAMKSFARKMRTSIQPLIKEFWSVDLREHDDTQLVRYTAGGRYETHQDAGADLENRYFTVICYLNENFSGGQTQFPYLGHAAVPLTGKAIVFPAKYFHRAEPVIAGEKYVLVSWVLGPVPLKWI